MTSPIITEEMLPAFQGVVPAVIASASASGVPNATYISQVYYVDDKHVALSRQFFNKTVRNLSENPMVRVALTCPVTYSIYNLLLRFKSSEQTGQIFEEMSMQLEAIAGIQGKSDTFNLLAADIFEVEEIERIYPF